jgi:hypothetical protein
VGTHIIMGHIKVNNDNTAPIFVGLHKTTQKTRTPQEAGGAREAKGRHSQANVL